MELAGSFHPLRRLRANILRSLLTLACLICCAALIVLAADLGTDSGATGSGPGYDALADSISITSGTPHAPQAMGRQSLSDSDVSALSRHLDRSVVAHVVPIAKGSALVRHGGVQLRGTLSGSTPDYLAYKNIPLTGGTMFDQSQFTDGARVALLGPNIAKALFPKGANGAIGSSVVIGRLTFRVIGTVEHDATGNGGWSIIAPLTTVRNDLLGGIRTVGEIGLVSTSPAAATKASALAKTILENSHTPKKSNFTDDFSSTTFQSATTPLVSKLLKILRYCAFVAIAVTFVVGLIGLTVTARETVSSTGESGLRTAGHSAPTRPGRFLRPLAEASTTALVAGIVGVGIAVGVILGGEAVFPGVVPLYLYPDLSRTAIIVALGVSLLAGVLAGSYPVIHPNRPKESESAPRRETARRMAEAV